MNESLSFDPAGHIKLAVSDFAKSKEFYTALFKRLECKQVADHEEGAAWVTREGFGIWISPASLPEPAYTFSAPGLHHVCLKARSKEEVDALYDFMKSKTQIFDAPTSYPDYSPQYYAFFFADPDGIKLEVAYY